MNVRIAKPEDAARIAELEAAVGCKLPLDLSGAEQFWIVAELDGVVQACAQVMLGLPVSAIELLAINPELSRHLRGKILLQIIPAGFAALHQKGAQYCTALIPFGLKGYRKALEKRGCAVMERGSLLVKRLR